MLLTGTETLHLAAKHGWALAAFAVYNLEMVQAIVAAAEEADRPVLLLAGSSHFHHAGQTALMNMALTAAHSTSAPIGVHLDHCRDLPEMQRCLDAGYSSVMIDGSHLSFEDNIRFTHEAATLAHRAGAWIEAELGAVPGDEDVSTNALPSQTMTDPLQARDFVERTGIDALAVAVGNVHGFTANPVTLDLERLNAIAAQCPVPLVLHGASGLPPEQLRGALSCGVAKVNVNAELRRAYLSAVERSLPQGDAERRRRRRMEGGPRRCHGRGAKNHQFVGPDLRTTKHHRACHRAGTLEKGTTMTAPLNTTLYMRPDRNLALELVRVTEAGAMAAGRWVGRGDKEGGDGAAVDAMRQLVSSVSMRGVVVIGEGEKDEAPMLYNGEEVGNGLGPDCDFAVDPVDGTTLMAKGMPNAISVLAVAERGAMFDPSAVFYMNKIAVGPDAADAIDITAPISENMRAVAKAKKSSVSDLTVCILDRPRHAELIAQVRETGARIRLISDGDVAGAIAAARPESGTDLLIGTGGTPEGIIAAAAMRCMGGALQARLAPTDDAERQKAIDAGHDLDRILSTEDLVSGDNVFFTATGVTDGDLLRGVRYSGGGAHTQSIVMRSKSGTVRVIEAYHRLDKLREYASIDFTGDDNAPAPMP